jgi:N-acetylmuramoyl-L-alanine amidase
MSGSHRRQRALVAAIRGAAGIAALACGPRVATPPAPSPRPAVTEFPVLPTPELTTPEERRGLPSIPVVTGAPLVARVVYPPREQLVQSRDSTFIIGSVGSGDAQLTIDDAPVEVKPNGAFLAWLPIPGGTTPSYRLIVRRGADSVVLVHPVQTFRSVQARAAQRPPTPATPALPPLTSGYIALGPIPTKPDTDRVISIRPVPNGTYKWFALSGTVVERTGVENGFTRIRLDSGLEAYVAPADVVELTNGSTPRGLPSRVVPNLVVAPDSAWTDVIFPVRDAPPFLVEEDRDKLVITLYSTRATTDIISYRTGDSLIRAITWEPLTTDRVRYTVHLRQAPFGYQVFHDGRALVMRVRKPPVVEAKTPLHGIVIAVDAGHPPAGSTGPTGLYEGDATLPISMELKRELESRGARVVMTRTTFDSVALGDRPIMARRANAHALISIHLNAVPDNVNPLTAHGTGTYFFHPHSEPLARAVQDGMVQSMQLRDLGVFYDNLALVRPTWMPAILCEGAFVIVPEQEAAMRDPEGQRAYARGVAAGVEAYFRAFAR